MRRNAREGKKETLDNVADKLKRKAKDAWRMVDGKKNGRRRRRVTCHSFTFKF